MNSPPVYDSSLTSYLQLPHLLSLTWLAYPILSLIFVAFRLQASLASSQDAIDSAKENLLASCKAAEEAATSTASMPRYMAIATNEQFADAVNASLRGARAALVLSLTVMEAIINFIIDLYRSIFLCFLELVVRGGLAIMIGAVEEINNVLSTVTAGLRTEIQNGINSINGVVISAIEGINRVNPFGDIPVPRLEVPDLSGLENVALPSSFQDSLVRLNETIPTVSTIKEKLQDIINTPFELLKQDINDTFSAISFNSSVLPVPEQNRLTFCSEMDMTVVDNLGQDIVKTAKIGIIILLLIALLLIGINCLLTWYKWRCMQSHLEYTRQAWNTDPTMHTKGAISATPTVALSDHNLMILQANSEHPLVTRITNQIALKFGLSPRTHTHMQWFFNYIFHPPAAACFLIGLFGLLLIEIQLLAMGPLVAKYQNAAAESSKEMSALIANSINQSMLNQSMAYAADVNAQVDVIQTTINDGVFGWVDGTIGPINTTITEFYDDVQNAVESVFGGTILEVAAREFIRCVIGTKVDAIENALTFLHDNLKVDMPRVNETALMLSPETVEEASAPIAAAAMGGGAEDQDGGLVGRLVNSYANTLRKERITFGIFLGLWGVVVIMALLILFWHTILKPWWHRRQQKKYERTRRTELPEGFVIPYRDTGSMSPEKRGPPGLALSSDDLPAFTPMPSPRKSVFKPFWATRASTPDGESHQVQTFANVGPDPSPPYANEPDAGDKVSPFQALKSKFGGLKKKESEPEPQMDYWNSGNRPVRIVVDTPADLSATQGQAEPPVPSYPLHSSRWVDDETKTASWTKRLFSPPMKNSATLPPLSHEITPTLAHKSSAPSELGGSNNDPFRSPPPIVPSLYPIPLHTAYVEPATRDTPQQLVQTPPRRFVAPYPPTPSSASSMNTLHKRTSSAPALRVTNHASMDQRSLYSGHGNGEGSVTSLDRFLRPADSTQRLLTAGQDNGRGQRASANSMNPFITPFDDEHRVEIISPPANSARKSVNPFTGGVAY